MEGGHRPRTSVADGGPPWRPARFASFVVEELAEAIVSGALAEGDVLPTEPALCEQFGFSRTVVREGLKMLEERGLVRVEQGRGTTVQPRERLEPARPGRAPHRPRPRPRHVAARRPDRRPASCSSARWRKAAAGRLTEDELAALAENLEQMNASYDDYERFRSFDLAFHAVVMKASGNEVGLTIVRAIHRHGGITPLLAAGASREALERTAREHRAIYEALAARDGELAGDRIAVAHRIGLGGARGKSARTVLTAGDHSYDDHPRCASQRSTST